MFVDAVEHISTEAGLDPALLALIIAPIATELPEKFNSLIWVRQDKDTLAHGQHHRRDGLPVVHPDVDRRSCWPPAPGLISQETLLSFASAGIAFASTAVDLRARWCGGVR